MNRWRSGGLALAALLVMSGCHFSQLPDPNAQAGGLPMSGEVMQRNIGDLYATLGFRVRRGEITQDQSQQIIDRYVKKIAEEIEPETVPIAQAWRYGDILRQAGRWEDAYAVLSVALKNAKDDDRRVNDALQLARVAAHLGKVDEAFSLVRGTFSAPAGAKAPILMSVLYEITPELAGKNRDVDTAKLLEEAIGQHRETIVDPASPAGRGFIAARPFHIARAWSEILRLYDKAGEADLARAAVERSEKMAKTYGNV